MSMTSNPNDVTFRLRSRLEADRRQMEETAASELRRLGESLRAVASGALRTIEADTDAWRPHGCARSCSTAWLRPLVVGLSIILGFRDGSWATMRWLSASSVGWIETLAALNVEIERARETLAEIEETSWGVTLRELDGERFAAPAGGSLADPPWTVGGLPALKLSNEGGSSMTELEVIRRQRLWRGCPLGVRSWNSGGTASRTKPCSSESSGSTGR